MDRVDGLVARLDLSEKVALVAGVDRLVEGG